MREELVLLFFNITEQQSDKIKYFLGSPREGIGKNNCFHFDDAHFFFFDVRSFVSKISERKINMILEYQTRWKDRRKGGKGGFL